MNFAGSTDGIVDDFWLAIGLLCNLYGQFAWLAIATALCRERQVLLCETLSPVVPPKLLQSLRGPAFVDYLSSIGQISRLENLRLSESKGINKQRRYSLLHLSKFFTASRLTVCNYVSCSKLVLVQNRGSTWHPCFQFINNLLQYIDVPWLNPATVTHCCLSRHRARQSRHYLSSGTLLLSPEDVVLLAESGCFGCRREKVIEQAPCSI